MSSSRNFSKMAAGTRRFHIGGDTRIVSTGDSGDEDDLELLRQAALRSMANKKMVARDTSNDGYESESSSSTEYEDISLNSPPEQTTIDHDDFSNESSVENSNDKEYSQTSNVPEEEEEEAYISNSSENVNSSSKVESLTITVENDDSDSENNDSDSEKDDSDSENDDSNVYPEEDDCCESIISIDNNDINNDSDHSDDDDTADDNNYYDSNENQSGEEESEEEQRVVHEEEMSDYEQSGSETVDDIIEMDKVSKLTPSNQKLDIATMDEEVINAINSEGSLKQDDSSSATVTSNGGKSVFSKAEKEKLIAQKSNQNRNTDKDRDSNIGSTTDTVSSKVIIKDTQKSTKQLVKIDTKANKGSTMKQTEESQKQEGAIKEIDVKLNEHIKVRKSSLKDFESKSKIENDKTKPKSIVTQQKPLEEDRLSIGDSSSESCDELDEELRKAIETKISPKNATKKSTARKLSTSHKRSRSRSPNSRQRSSSHERNSLVNNRGRHYLNHDRHSSRNDRFTGISKSPFRRSRSPLGRRRRSPSPVRRERSTKLSRSPQWRDSHLVRKARSPLRSTSPQKSSNSLRKGRRSSRSPITRHRSRSTENRLHSSRSPSRLHRQFKSSRTPVRRKQKSPTAEQSKSKRLESGIDSSKRNDLKITTDILCEDKARTHSETKSASSTKENTVVQKTVKSEKKDISVSKQTMDIREKKVVLDKLDARNLLSKKPVAVTVVKKVKMTDQLKTADNNSDDLRHIIKKIPESESVNPLDVKEKELDARIAKIRQNNLDILKRNMEIEKEKALFG